MASQMGALDSGENDGAPQVIYVRSDAPADPPPDGLSWASAFSDLQEAMNRAEPGQQLWVKKGRYFGVKQNRAVLRLKDGVDVFGSFDGDESAVTDRPPLSVDADPTTVLDGDWNRNGGIDDEDSPVVVFAVSIRGARLGGVLVTGAKDSGMLSLASAVALNQVVFRENGRNDFGGGLHSQVGSAVVLTDVRFEKNKAEFGGGMYSQHGSEAVLTDVRFEDNVANEGAGFSNKNAAAMSMIGGGFFSNRALTGQGLGGGMVSSFGSESVLTDVLFEDNEAHVGAGIHNEDSALVMTGGGFFFNRALTGQGLGGGMFNFAGSESELTDVHFEDNAANQGAGINNRDSALSMSGGGFFSNRALTGQGIGGGILSGFDAEAVLTDVRFEENAANRGAGMGAASMSVLVNVLFSRNTAEEFGGGILMDFGAQATLVNVTMVENRAKIQSSGVRIVGEGTRATITNSVFWGNTVGPQANDVDGASDISNSCSAQVLDGSEKLESSPFEIGPNGEFFLRRASGVLPNPCINAGHNPAANDVGFLWCARTTSAGGDLDEGPVDAGFHYAPIDPLDAALECTEL